jgi:hypothetical protein
MMQVFIENRQIDLMANEDLLITREIADIREPEKRSSDWSKTFRIPGTSNNNKIFGHIFDINQEQLNSGSQFAPDFNPNKKAAARITVDEVEQIRGFVRLLNIAIIRKGEIEYEVSVHGVAADFFAKIRNKRMSEIDLSGLNHTLTRTAIKNSWNHNAADGYVYAMIDKGRDDKPFNAWGATDLTPCIYAKYIVDRIMTEAGYSYTSDSFFNSDEFKDRVVPFTKQPEISEATLTTFALRARRSSNATVAVGGTVIFNDDSSTGYYDNGSNYSTVNGKYSIPNSGVEFSAKYDLDVSVTGLSATTYTVLAIDFQVLVAGRQRGFFTAFATNQPLTGANFDINSFIYLGTAASGSEIQLIVKNVYDFSNSIASTIPDPFTVTVKTNSIVEIEGLQSVTGVGMTLDFNSLFSASEVTQDRFISDLIKMDNLFIEPTDLTGQLYIAPYSEFYRTDVVHDLTTLIDRSQPMEIIPMGELDGNPYIFTMTQGKDIDSEDYAKATGKVYGETRIIVDNEFITQERKIETKIASTPYIHAGGQYLIASMASEDKTAGEIRMLYWSGKITNVKWTLADYVFTSPYSTHNPELIENGYPHAGHLDDPFSPTRDLNFGMPQYINLPAGITYTNNNLYNRNWRKYINEITDRNSKIVRCMVYVTPAQWAKWSFRDLYFFDGQYFRLNKITDYPVGGSELVQCEFLKLKTGSQFTAQTGKTGGGWDAKDDNNDRWPDLRNGFDKPSKEFATGSQTGSNSRNFRGVENLLKGIGDYTQADLGTPSSGDNFRVAIQWDGADWNINLIQEI